MESFFLIAILIFSVVLHEIAHGYTALSLGDFTAKNAGRLTLNPLPHLDPIGSFLVPGLLLLLPGSFIIGWARPVPVNPSNFHDQRYGSAKVSFAGPAANFAIAVFFGLLLRFLSAPIVEILPGLIPLFVAIVQLNLLLAIFNLLPFPPLDGSHIFFDLLPRSWYPIRQFLEQYGILILIFFIFFFFRVLTVPVEFTFRLLTGF